MGQAVPRSVDVEIFQRAENRQPDTVELQAHLRIAAENKVISRIA